MGVKLGKHHHNTFSPKIDNHFSHLSSLVHRDVWGLLRVEHGYDFACYIIFVDDLMSEYIVGMNVG